MLKYNTEHRLEVFLLPFHQIVMCSSKFSICHLYLLALLMPLPSHYLLLQ